MRLSPASALTATACALAMTTVSGRAATPAPRDVLRSIAPIEDSEWAAAERGNPLAKIVETDAREIAVVGAVRINAPSDRLIQRYRTIETLKGSAIVIDVGRFGDPPQSTDLQAVPFELYSLDLRDCRPFDCRVRLSESDIARFHREVDWSAPDWRARSASLWRTVLTGYVDAYARRGRSALPVFANKREPLSVAAEFSKLVSRFEFVRPYAPELLDYMRELAPPPPDGAEHVVYWSKENFGVRPVLRVSHQVIYRGRTETPAIVIATNQIYADHYLDAALTVTLAIEAAAGERRSFYMISLSRARTRSLSGLLRSFVRTTVQNRSRDALRKILTSTRIGLESATP
jgi:hypothetical protein